MNQGESLTRLLYTGGVQLRPPISPVNSLILSAAHDTNTNTNTDTNTYTNIDTVTDIDKDTNTNTNTDTNTYTNIDTY